MRWQEYAEQQQFAREKSLQQCYEQSLIPLERGIIQEEEDALRD